MKNLEKLIKKLHPLTRLALNHKIENCSDSEILKYLQKQYKEVKIELETISSLIDNYKLELQIEKCNTCLYENNIKDDNTCGLCNPNTPQSNWTPKRKLKKFK